MTRNRFTMTAIAGLRTRRAAETGGVGFRSVRFSPFMLETNLEFHTHHILRKAGARVEQVCQFAGESRSSTSKGMGSAIKANHVEVTELLGRTPRFRVSATGRRGPA